MPEFQLNNLCIKGVNTTQLLQVTKRKMEESMITYSHDLGVRARASVTAFGWSGVRLSTGALTFRRSGSWPALRAWIPSAGSGPGSGTGRRTAPVIRTCFDTDRWKKINKYQEISIYTPSAITASPLSLMANGWNLLLSTMRATFITFMKCRC